MIRTIAAPLALGAVLGMVSPVAAHQPDLDDLRQQAVKTAARKVGPCVVQIQTSGGTDIIGTGPRGGAQVRKGMGPTTGVILTADGYIASSAFNFANKPSSIDVAVPGHKTRYV